MPPITSKYSLVSLNGAFSKLMLNPGESKEKKENEGKGERKATKENRHEVEDEGRD